LMYAKVKQTRTTKSGTSSGIAVKDKKGVLLTEPEDVKNRSKEYIEELYCSCDKPKLEELGIERESDVDEDNKG